MIFHRIFCFINLTLAIMSFLSLADKLIPSGTLYGWAVVLDPGHGGIDPGSSVNLGGGKIVEDEYVYDVTLRAARLIRERDGLVFLTIKKQRNRTQRGGGGGVFVYLNKKI